VSNGGGSCTRSDVPVYFSSATACPSFAAAYNAASGGDMIAVQSGSYGAQTVPTRSLGSSPVTFQAEGGLGSVTLTGGLTVNSSYVTLDGFQGASGVRFLLGTYEGCTATPGHGWPCPSSYNHITLSHFKFNYGLAGADYVTLSHGEIGPADPCAGTTSEDGLQFYGRGNAASPSSSPNSHVLIDDVYIHNVHNSGFPSPCGAHTDAIQGFGYDHWVIRNSRFANNDTCVLAYSQNNANAQDVDSITIENNVFSSNGALSHCISLGNNGSTPCGSDNHNNLIQNNTFLSGLVADTQCGGGVTATFRNNIVVQSFWCGQNAASVWAYDYDAFANPGANCSTTSHARVCSPTFANGSGDLSPSDTCARDSVLSAPGTYSGTDIHGTPRPLGAAPDIGADEG
jgi:hypothetical protein